MLSHLEFVNTLPIEFIPKLEVQTAKRLNQDSHQIVHQLFDHMMEALPPGVEKPHFTPTTFYDIAQNLGHNQRRLSHLLETCFHYPEPEAQETAFNICIKVFFYATLIRQMAKLVNQAGKAPQAGQPDVDEQFDIDLGIYLVYLFDEIIDRVVLDRNSPRPTDTTATVLEKLVSEADRQIFESPNFYFDRFFEASKISSGQDNTSDDPNCLSLACYLAPLREMLGKQDVPPTQFDWLIHSISDVTTGGHQGQLAFEQFLAQPVPTANGLSYRSLPQSFLTPSDGYDNNPISRARLIAQAILQNQGLLLVTITTLISCDHTALSKLPEFIQTYYPHIIKLFSLVRLTDDLIDRQIDTEAGVVNIFTAPEAVKMHFLDLQEFSSGDMDYQLLWTILFSPDRFRTEDIYAHLKAMRTRIWDQLSQACADQREFSMMANVMNFVVQAAFVNGTIDDRQIAVVAKALQTQRFQFSPVAD